MIVTPLGWVAIVVWVAGAPIAAVAGARWMIRNKECEALVRIGAAEAALFWPLILAAVCLWKLLGYPAALARDLERRRTR